MEPTQLSGLAKMLGGRGWTKEDTTGDEQ